MRKRTKVSVGIATIAAGVVMAAFVGTSLTRAADNNFSLQVSPSPLVTTLKPGETKTVELKIRNASSADEKLKIEARAFTFNPASGGIALDDTLSPGFASWITLPQPGFTVKPGEWQTEKITFQLPRDTGFSYSFALIISRNDNAATISNGRLLQGSVAVFTLINVDRPGAVRKLDLSAIETDQAVYEYLPSTINIRLKNTGNTIVQPYGNVFIQQGTSAEPLATLPVNSSQSYILPNTERTLSATWSDGFPVYQTATDSSGLEKTSLKWNIDQLSHFRFGPYTAKVVAVYNDGTRDIPIVGEVTFWVVPWKTLTLLVVVVVGLIFLLRYILKRRTARAVQKALAAQRKEQ